MQNCIRVAGKCSSSGAINGNGRADGRVSTEWQLTSVATRQKPRDPIDPQGPHPLHFPTAASISSPQLRLFGKSLVLHSGKSLWELFTPRTSLFSPGEMSNSVSWARGVQLINCWMEKSGEMRWRLLVNCKKLQLISQTRDCVNWAPRKAVINWRPLLKGVSYKISSILN